MAKRSRECVSSQVQLESDQLEESAGLPFRDLLSGEKILAALERAEHVLFQEFPPVWKQANGTFTELLWNSQGCLVHSV